MPFRGAPSVDPQKPSTSTALARRIEDNKRKFENFFPQSRLENAITLWEVCTEKTCKIKFQSQIRSLRGVCFSTILIKYKVKLDELAALSGTTFKEICDGLRFFSYYKRKPVFKSNDESAIKLFHLISNCIFYSNNEWTADMNDKNIFEPVSMDILKCKRLNKTEEIFESERKFAEKQKSRDAMRAYLVLPSVNQKSLPTPTKRLQDREKVPVPPPPTWKTPPRPYYHLDDENLKEMHRLNFSSTDSKFNCLFEKTLKHIVKNNRSVRTKLEELSDLEYYGDETILPSPQFSLKLDTVMQIPKFDIPKIENDGYFPPNRTDYEWYLFEKYLEANETCAEIFKAIRSPDQNPIKKEFVLGTIKPGELYNFHVSGRHIQGFYDVWVETERGWKTTEGKWEPRRYLVDMYNRLMFPLYVDWQYWPATLKWAFDKYSLYALRLTTFIKKYPTEIQKAGAAVFSRYSHSRITARVQSDFSTTKGRNQYLNTVQMENNGVIDRYTKTPLINEPTLETDIRKRKRKAKHADEEIQSIPAALPQAQETPRKPFDSPKQAITKVASVSQPVQKENMEKTSSTLPTPTPSSAVPSTSPIKINSLVPRRTPPHRTPSILQRSFPTPKKTALASVTAPAPQVTPPAAQLTTPPMQLKISPTPLKTPPTAVKRRLPQHEVPYTPGGLPARKKMSFANSCGTWDNHFHNSAEEEHVDEKKVKEKEEEEQARLEAERQAVWVPKEEGLEPEQYAGLILDHYPGDKKQSQVPSTTPGSLPKTPKRRKSGIKISPNPASIPSTSRGLPSTSSSQSAPPLPTATSSHSSITAAASLVHTTTPMNGNLSVPPGKTIVNRARALYTSKTATTPNRQRTVYPVKQLAPPTSTSSPVVLNGTTSGGMSNLRAPVTGSTAIRPPYQGTPYYPAGMRPKTMPHHLVSPSSASTSILATQNQNRGSSSTSTPNVLKSVVNRNPNYPLPPHRQVPTPLRVQTSHRSALEQQFGSRVTTHLINNVDSCQRVIPFNAQCELHAEYRYRMKMAKGEDTAREPPRKWPKSAFGPGPIQPSTSMKAKIPSVSRSQSNRPMEASPVPYRPRSFSNTIQRPKGSIPPIAAPTVAPSMSSSTSSNAIERTVGVAKYRQETPLVTNNRVKTEQLRTTVQRLVAERMKVPMSPTASMATLESSSMVEPCESKVTVRSLTTKIRKMHGKMTPEEFAAVIKNESERFKQNGDDSPSVKSILLNFQS